MTIYELSQANREGILQTAAKYGAYNVRIFGSVARGEADASSNVDLSSRNGTRTKLVRFGRTIDGLARITQLQSRYPH
jgi:predicted nucleotidyltransferase